MTGTPGRRNENVRLADSRRFPVMIDPPPPHHQKYKIVIFSPVIARKSPQRAMPLSRNIRPNQPPRRSIPARAMASLTQAMPSPTRNRKHTNPHTAQRLHITAGTSDQVSSPPTMVYRFPQATAVLVLVDRHPPPTITSTSLQRTKQPSRNIRPNQSY